MSGRTSLLLVLAQQLSRRRLLLQGTLAAAPAACQPWAAAAPRASYAAATTPASNNDDDRRLVASGAASPTTREPETPLLRSIRNRIMIRGGPLTLAEYMSEVLTNPLSGYYTSAGGEMGPMASAAAGVTAAEEVPPSPASAHAERSVFGARGDFVTSPEISQLFGEMICVWCLALWLSQGKPPRVRLVELGPGRGTLMADALRAAAASFPSFAAAVQDVRLVELSPALRAAQWRALECEPMLADAAAEKAAGDANPPGPRRRGLSRLLARSSGGGGGGGVPVTWHASLDEVPGRVRVRDGEGKSGDGPPEFVVEPEEEQQEEAKGEGGAASTDGGTRSPPRSAPPPSPSAPPCATIYIAHEFFDALPVHQFQYAPPRGRQRGQAAAADGCWLERMVDVQEGESGGGGDSGVVVGGSGGSGGANSSTNNGDSSNLHLRFVLSPSTTPAAALLVPRRLAALAPEQRALLQADAPPALTPSSSSSSSAAPEKTHQVRAIEVSAHGMAVAEALALRVGLNGSGGGALVIDYGRGAPYASSLTAVRGHRRHPHPLSLPGAADLSAWVDFSALAQAARESGAPVAVHGPVAQGAFLGALGALERAEQLAVAAADAAAAEKAAEGHEGMERAARDAAEAVAAAYRRLVGGGEQGMGETYKALAIVPAGGGGGAAAGGSGGGGASSPSSPPSIVAQPSPPPVGFGGGVADESMAGVGGL